MPGRFAVALAVVAAALLTGCGDGGDGTTDDQPEETTDAPAALPRGWREYVDSRAGFSIGVPPGWKARARGSGSLITSPDGGASLGITADRTDEALDEPPPQFARDLARSARGVEDLKAGRPRPYSGAHYRAARVDATGRRVKDGIQLRITALVLKRDDLAVYPILILKNEKVRAGLYEPDLRAIVASLRGRPVEVPSG